MTITIPIRNRARQVTATTIVDDQDEVLAQWSWCLNRPGGYAVRTIPTHNGPRLQGMSRQILGLEYGNRLQADHIDHDKLNNTRRNLRIVTPLGQQQNKAIYQGSKSRFRGVYRHAKGKWEARVVLDGRTHYLGHYESEIQAALAAHRFRTDHMPWATVDPPLLDLLGPRLI
jgi:AP2 domain/HNH endonuclease